MREKDSIQENVKDKIVRMSEVLAYLDSDRLMDKSELAQFLGWSERKITSRVQEIPHFRDGRELKFRKSEILQWLEQYREIGTQVDLEQIGNAAKARQKWAVKRGESNGD